jgi:tRNA pseudouridine32 synthase / 23S rRNA pseudouridine746 synthase
MLGQHMLVKPIAEMPDWVAVDKPAGMLSVPGRSEHSSALSWARERYGQAHAVHRLDQATSGILLMALNKDAERALAAQFRLRSVSKRYVAVVQGLLEADAGVIDAPLNADWPNRPLQKVDWREGKPSQTQWQVVSRNPAEQTTRLQLVPITGRSHQLRVHLLSIGHPIVGDKLYNPSPSTVAQPRLLLHAEHLAFDGLGTAGRVALDCPAQF